MYIRTHGSKKRKSYLSTLTFTRQFPTAVSSPYISAHSALFP